MAAIQRYERAPNGDLNCPTGDNPPFIDLSKDVWHPYERSGFGPCFNVESFGIKADRGANTGIECTRYAYIAVLAANNLDEDTCEASSEFVHQSE
jgi:hypothetical protein